MRLIAIAMVEEVCVPLQNLSSTLLVISVLLIVQPVNSSYFEVIPFPHIYLEL